MPDEEALFATPSSESFVPERAIEIFKRGRYSESDLALLDTLTQEQQQRAYLIAVYDATRSATARALRDGAPLPIDGISLPFVDKVGGATREIVDSIRAGSQLVADSTKESVDAVIGAFVEQAAAQIEAVQGTGEFLDAFGPPQRTPHQVDELRRNLNELVGGSPGGPPPFGCLTLEGIDRLHNGILASVTADTQGLPPGLAELKQAEAFVDGITGRVEPRGTDYSAFRALPEGSAARRAGGWVVEQLTDPVFVVGAVGGGGIGGLIAKKAGWVAGPILGKLGTEAVVEALTFDCDGDQSDS